MLDDCFFDAFKYHANSFLFTDSKLFTECRIIRGGRSLEDLYLAEYASLSSKSKGRLFHEKPAEGRTLYQRDRDRVLHSGAFRKLQYKTQVFVYHEGDYYRTRLTHTIEVAQIARSLSRNLNFNEDLSEAVALSHDLGHTPFGHAGEEILDKLMKPYGGFNHNEQALRILTKIERRYPGFDGLNLTFETIDGIIKHNGPIRGKPAPLLLNLQESMKLNFKTFGTGEAQLAAIADDIAYNAHDIDDGLRAQIFKITDLEKLSLVSPLISKIKSDFGSIDESRLISELVRKIVDKLVADILAETANRLQKIQPADSEDIMNANQPIVSFSKELMPKIQQLREFLFAKMYRHYKVNRMASKAKRVIGELFNLFIEEPSVLPDEWQYLDKKDLKNNQARLISDYIAGMTDRYALLEYDRLFDIKAKL